MPRLIALLVVLLMAACGGDDEAPKSLYSEPCSSTDDCAAELMCAPGLGICSQSCATMQECRDRLGSPTSLCIGGVCQEPCEPGSMTCVPYGLSCVSAFSGSTCRQP